MAVMATIFDLWLWKKPTPLQSKIEIHLLIIYIISWCPFCFSENYIENIKKSNNEKKIKLNWKLQDINHKLKIVS